MNINEQLVRLKSEYGNVIYYPTNNYTYILKYLTYNEYLGFLKLILSKNDDQRKENLYIAIYEITVLYSDETSPSNKTKALLGEVVFEKSKISLDNLRDNLNEIENTLLDIDVLFISISQAFPSYKLEDIYNLNRGQIYKLFLLSLTKLGIKPEVYLSKLLGDKRSNIPKHVRENITQTFQGFENPINLGNIDWEKENRELEQFLNG